MAVASQKMTLRERVWRQHLARRVVRQMRAVPARRRALPRLVRRVAAAFGQRPAPRLMRFLDVIRGAFTAAPTKLEPVMKMPLRQHARATPASGRGAGR